MRHKAESQDICFVPDGDYASFIARYMGFGGDARCVATEGVSGPCGVRNSGISST